MTRIEIETEYKVENGRIVSPGQFEGEMIYAPYFWDLALNGGSDQDEYFEDGGWAAVLSVSDEDREEFPELRNAAEISIFQNDSGFIYAEISKVTK